MMTDDIKDRLTRLEATNQERWLAHDKRALDLKEAMAKDFGEVKYAVREIAKDVGSVVEKIASMPFNAIEVKIGSNRTHIKWIWGLLSGILLALAGGFIRIVAMNGMMGARFPTP